MAPGLLVLVLCAAEPRLTPSPDLAARLAELEQQRTLIAQRRARASVLHLAAGPVYGLALASAAWGIIERVKQAQNPTLGPLQGPPYAPPVAPDVMFATAVGLGVMALALTIYAGSINFGAGEDEAEVNDEERALRKQPSAKR